MLQRHCGQPAVAPDDAGEARHRASACFQPGQFSAGVEILGADADADHPPVTGGHMATSFAPVTVSSIGSHPCSSATPPFRRSSISSPLPSLTLLLPPFLPSTSVPPPSPFPVSFSFPFFSLTLSFFFFFSFLLLFFF